MVKNCKGEKRISELHRLWRQSAAIVFLRSWNNRNVHGRFIPQSHIQKSCDFPLPKVTFNVVSKSLNFIASLLGLIASSCRKRENLCLHFDPVFAFGSFNQSFVLNTPRILDITKYLQLSVSHTSFLYWHCESQQFLSDTDILSKRRIGRTKVSGLT